MQPYPVFSLGGGILMGHKFSASYEASTWISYSQCRNARNWSRLFSRFFFGM